MDFGMFLDFSTRPGRGHESAFQEAFDLVDLAEETGLDTVWLGETHFNGNRPISAPMILLMETLKWLLEQSQQKLM